VKGIFDTCILIDYLNAIVDAKEEISKYHHKMISCITYMEVMVGTNDQNKGATEIWLESEFEIIAITKEISDKAIEIRKSSRIKLPDAIIYATAQINDCLLITRNTRDFSDSEPSVRVPYTL
jgi:hypothetical protein